MFLSITAFTQPALSYLVLNLALTKNSQHVNARPPDTAEFRLKAVLPSLYCAAKILLYCYGTDKSLGACIFARFKVNREVVLLRSFTIFS